MNWGHKITLTIGVFLAGMSGMVFLASRQSNEMIDEKYYEKEMAYQQLIDARGNLKQYTNASLLSQEDNALCIRIPAALVAGMQAGSVQLLRRENKKMDLQFPLQPDAAGIQRIAKTQLQPGWYTARIQWKNSGKTYYSSENIRIIP